MRRNMKVMDRLKITTYDESGNVADYRVTYDPNNIDHRIALEAGSQCFANDLILDTGLADIALMVAMRYGFVSVGAGTTIPEHDDIGLESEILDRSVAATSLSTTFYTNDTANFTGSFTPTYNVSISESGVHLLSGTSGDITFARETFTPLLCIADIPFNVAWSTIFMR